jgi:hypothetical protein
MAVLMLFVVFMTARSLFKVPSILSSSSFLLKCHAFIYLLEMPSWEIAPPVEKKCHAGLWMPNHSGNSLLLF